MPKSDRLLRLMHLLRLLPPPATATRLAEEAEVSVRTIYRDIAALRASGARIDGSAGFGYTLTEDPALPPMQFDRDEIEALLVGLSLAAQTGDATLARAGRDATAKLVARLPDAGQRQALHAVHYVNRLSRVPVDRGHAAALRAACWDERAVDLDYTDKDGAATRRRIWPLTIAYFDATMEVLAWCCLRHDYRRFRIDRIAGLSPAGDSFRGRRVPLLQEYVARMQAATPDRPLAKSRGSRDAASPHGPTHEPDATGETP